MFLINDMLYISVICPLFYPLFLFNDRLVKIIN